MRKKENHTIEYVAAGIVDVWVSRLDTCERAQDGNVEGGSELFAVLIFTLVRLGIRIIRARVISVGI